MHKGFVLAKNSLLSSVLVAVFCLAILSTGVLAAHDTVVTIDPSIANCEQLGQTYTVSVYNKDTSADSIREVRIYRDVDGDGYADPGIVEFSCGPAPTGWTLDDRTALYHYCQYETSIIGGYMIDPGETETFTFSATLENITEECGNKFKVASIDDVVPIGQVRFKFPFVKVDCVDPVIDKELKLVTGAPGYGIGVCPPSMQNPGEECWITQSECVYFEAYDEDDECDLGLDYCDWSYTVDGVYHDGGTVEPGNGHASKLICFDEDSLHELTITCYDIAGNIAEDVERFRVDDTPPETEKLIGDPKKVISGDDQFEFIEWVDGVTEITLTAEDPDDTGQGCAIGVDKTWYMNVIDLTENACWDPYVYCNPLDFPTPYDQAGECIDFCQEECSDLPSPDWEYCVEMCAHDKCGVDPLWKLYKGEPIQKPEESCHVFQYFSVDRLGNIEDMNVNCFFVDKTPPVPEKEVGDPKVPLCGIRDPEFYIETYDGDDMVKDETYPGPNTVVTKTLNCDKVVWDIELEDLGYDYGHTEFGIVIAFSDDKAEFQVGTGQMFGAGSPPIYQECDGPSMDPPYGCWAGGSGPTHDLPPGIVVTNPGGTGEPGYGDRVFHVEIPIEYLNNGDFYWAVSTAANWKEGYGFTRYPEEWVRWSSTGIYDYDGWKDWWVQDHGTEITLDCTDPEPHPSGDEEVCYKVSYDLPEMWTDITDQYCGEDLEEITQEGHEGDWCCVPAPETIIFVEDSLHDLEYFCRDAVDKKSEIDLEYFRVDSQPPIIEKTMIGDDHLGYRDGELNEDACPPKGENDDCFVRDDGENGVHIEVYDDDTYGCAVDDVICEKYLLWETTEQECENAGGVWLTSLSIDETSVENSIANNGGICQLIYDEFSDYQDVIFEEDSTHYLLIYCEDALGNYVIDSEIFYVDSTPPEIEKTYGEPQKVDPECAAWCESNAPPEEIDDCMHAICTWWITSDTLITLEAEDEKVGVDKIYWRNLYFPNNPEICDRLGYMPVGQEVQNGIDNCYPEYYLNKYYETDGWHEVDGDYAEFYKPEESCHVIEYYAVDKLGNGEIVDGDNCVDNLDGCAEYYWQCVYVDNTPPEKVKTHGTPLIPDDGFDWVTQDTTITLDCQDRQLHPVEQETLCFKVSLDSDTNGDGVPDEDGMQYITEDYCPGDLDPEGYCCVYVGEDSPDVEIKFKEDSYHNLEYYCVDHLGNDERDYNLANPPTDGHQITQDGAWVQYYKVDSTPPSVNKILNPPYYGDCPPRPNTKDVCFVDTATTIDLDVEDGGDICHVDGVECKWRYKVAGMEWSDWNSSFPMVFPEECQHTIQIECWDALGNKWTDEEYFYVDKTPPGIDKFYIGPYKVKEFDGYWSKYINSETEIHASVTDAGPHKSGIKEVKYRFERVDDDECKLYFGTPESETQDFECDETEGTADWTIVDPEDYDGWVFSITEDSCHLIEIMATDNVDKCSLHKQWVYVDNQGPDSYPFKEVGEPKAKWDGQDSNFYPWIADKCWAEGEDSIDCWKVTMKTPIRMNCEDPEPHPVGEKAYCFKVEMDGSDVTERYCNWYNGWYNKNDDGYCCKLLHRHHRPCNEGDLECLEEESFGVEDECAEGDLECHRRKRTFYFLEETEHNLKYYCVDRLGNVGPTDEEKFKVEGTKFEIPLYKKWNLISVPFVLLNSDPAEVFKDTPGVDTVWTYDPENCADSGDWCVWSSGEMPDNLNSIDPGWGYWVMEKNDPDGNCIRSCTEGDTACFGRCGVSEWLTIGGSLFSPRELPPSRNLVKGWNLIGYYGTSWEIYPLGDDNFVCGDAFVFPDRYIYGDKAYCSLNSLVDTQKGYPRWSSLWSYVRCPILAEIPAPHINLDGVWVGINTCADRDSPLQMALSRMYAGRGYWVEMDVEDQYAPATTCIWNEDFQCRWTGGGILP